VEELVDDSKCNPLAGRIPPSHEDIISARFSLDVEEDQTHDPSTRNTHPKIQSTRSSPYKTLATTVRVVQPFHVHLWRTSVQENLHEGRDSTPERKEERNRGSCCVYERGAWVYIGGQRGHQAIL
jgi:hypothetical protein